ncbi:MAG: PRC-barrel domain-containing protein [Patescibacteria group bacterium]
MIIELSELVGLQVRSTANQALGTVDFCVFNGKTATLVGFQVARPGVLKKFAGLSFSDVIDLNRQALVVENDAKLLAKLNEFDGLYKTYGPVVGVAAQTESGERLGRVADLFIEANTGAITRYHLRHFFQERIIPQQFLVAITPERIVFKDEVAKPQFTGAVAAEAAKS